MTQEMREIELKMQGREEGRIEGREEGRELERYDLISRLLKQGKSAQAISDFLGFPISQVMDVASKIN